MRNRHYSARMQNLLSGAVVATLFMVACQQSQTPATTPAAESKTAAPAA